MISPATFRPIPIWPHDSTPGDRRRSRWTFKAGWQNNVQAYREQIGQ